MLGVGERVKNETERYLPPWESTVLGHVWGETDNEQVNKPLTIHLPFVASAVKI